VGEGQRASYRMSRVRRVLRDVCGEPFTGVEQFCSLTMLYRSKTARVLCPGQQHCYPFGDTSPDEVASRRAPAVVQHPLRNPSPPAGVAECVAPRPDGHAVPMEDSALSARRRAARRSSTCLSGGDIGSTRPVLVLERCGLRRITPPARSTSSHTSSRISFRRQPE